MRNKVIELLKSTEAESMSFKRSYFHIALALAWCVVRFVDYYTGWRKV